jgi:hypothetical protein
MSESQIRQHAFAVLATVLAGDDDGLHDLMSGLDRDELDFLVTGLYALTAGFLVAMLRTHGHDDPRAAALRIVREMAVETAAEALADGDGNR